MKFMDTDTQRIVEELRSIRQELDTIKDRMVDRDMLLDAEEKKMLNESLEAEKKGKLLTKEELRKKLGV